MVKQSNGPDWTDVMMTMGALEVTHGCRVSLTVIAAGQGHNGGGQYTLTALWDRLPGSVLREKVEVKGWWPTGRAASFAAEVYRACLEADYAIGRTYRQEDFLEAV